MLTPSVIKDNHTKELCPCGKTSIDELQRIPRGLLVKTFLFWLPVKRYKCYKCRKTMLLRPRPLILKTRKANPV